MSTQVAQRSELTFKENARHGRHGWLRLTPAYSLRLVRQLLPSAGDALVLDPFSGTGTTVLAAIEMGMSAHGLDINPFLVWLGETKLRNFPAAALAGAREALGRALCDIHGDLAPDMEWRPQLSNVEKWWHADVLRLLSRAFHTMGLRDDHRSDVQGLLGIIFCKALISCANVSFGHQSMSFKQQEASLFDHTDTVADALSSAGAEVLADAEVNLPAGYHQFALGDARALDRAPLQQGYTHVITSPPYPNRMSYIRELRPYMYWLGYLNSPQDAGELDWQAIGGTWGCATSYVQNWSPPHPDAVDELFDRPAFEEIRGRSEVLANYVLKYFYDTDLHFASLRGVLAPGAQVHYIVGNSKYYDTMVHTEELYARILRRQGFSDIEIAVVRKRNSKKELFEYRVSAVAPG